MQVALQTLTRGGSCPCPMVSHSMTQLQAAWGALTPAMPLCKAAERLQPCVVRSQVTARLASPASSQLLFWFDLEDNLPK